MPIETLDDIVEAFANKLGVYGSHNESYCNDDQLCRGCWVSEMKARIERAVEIEQRLAATSAKPAEPSHTILPVCLICGRDQKEHEQGHGCGRPDYPAEPIQHGGRFHPSKHYFTTHRTYTGVGCAMCGKPEAVHAKPVESHVALPAEGSKS